MAYSQGYQKRTSKKFFKCKSCYASGAYCNHRTGGPLTRPPNYPCPEPRWNVGRKVFKCKACYSSGAYCTHFSGSGGSKKTPFKKEYATKKKKLPDAEKISAPVLDSEVCLSWKFDGVSWWD
jgi:hypothetical protein